MEKTQEAPSGLRLSLWRGGPRERRLRRGVHLLTACALAAIAVQVCILLFVPLGDYQWDGPFGGLNGSRLNAYTQWMNGIFWILFIGFHGGAACSAVLLGRDLWGAWRENLVPVGEVLLDTWPVALVLAVYLL